MLKPMNASDTTYDAGPDERTSAALWLGARDALGGSDAQSSEGRVATPSDVGGAFTSTVEGTVRRVDGAMMWLRGHAAAASGAEHGGEGGVFHELPAVIDLRPLLGLSVHVTTMSEAGAGEQPTKTLVVSGASGRVWLIARSGNVHGVTHAISPTCHESDVHAALSQRPDGPLVIGTEELQWLVPVGQSAHIRMRDGSVLRAFLVERRADGTASYVLADPSLFAETPS